MGARPLASFDGLGCKLAIVSLCCLDWFGSELAIRPSTSFHRFGCKFTVRLRRGLNWFRGKLADRFRAFSLNLYMSVLRRRRRRFYRLDLEPPWGSIWCHRVYGRQHRVTIPYVLSNL
jgi:hypothetical protein